MDGDNDESEKKLLKEFCNVSRNNCFKKGKKKLRIDFLFSIKDKRTNTGFVFCRSFPYKNIFF